MSFSEVMKEKNIVLPPANAPGGIYSQIYRDGTTVYVSGQTAKLNGVLQYKGKVGRDVSEEDGYQAAELCAKNALAQIEAYAGGIDRIDSVIKLVGYVNCIPEFTRQANVMNGASQIISDIFGECGLPVRSAVGVASLPGDSSVEVELIVKMKEV